MMKNRVIACMASVAGLALLFPQSLRAECRISVIEHGIVQAVAESELESFECFGRIHSRGRAEQMRILRQTGRGRLAEEGGLSFIRGDFVLRLLELERRAAKLEPGLPKEERQWLEAYARGVNAESQQVWSKDPWTVRDTLLMLLLQAFDQTSRSFEQDIVTDGHARKGHPLKMDFPWQTPILKPGEYRGGASGGHARLYPFEPEDGATGSNNWVVSPRFVKSKVAMLANDPHLQLKSPPFWQWVRIRWGDEERLGASLPGAPLVASGASRHMAWGLTNSYVDVADAVLVPRKTLKTRRVRPWIWFKLGWFKLPFFFKSFEVVEGADLPVLPIDSPEKDHAVVVRWTGFDLDSSEIGAAWRMGGSKDVAEMDRHLSRMGLPSWNYVFADTKGGIGYRVVGRLPRRSPRERGTMEVLDALQLGPMPVLSADEAPHVLNPARGWVATANQLQWGSDGLNPVGTIHTESFRGFRIEELLKQGLAGGHDVDSFQRIQCDAQSVDARFLLPVLLAGMKPTEATRRLASWDFEAGVECRECALFRAWMKELGDPQWTFARATQGDEASRAEFFAEAEAALERASVRVLRTGSLWPRWGDVHRAVFPATEARRPFVIEDLAQALSTPGDEHSVAPGSSDVVEVGERTAFSHHSGPSQRLVVEMTSPPRVHFILPESAEQRRRWAGCAKLDHLSW
jgi:penicillin amidase